MSERKKVLPTPIHLLHALSLDVVARLERACSKAIAETESMAGKLDKECEKVQEKLLSSRQHLQEATVKGKNRSRARSHQRVDELEQRLYSLKERRAQTWQQLASLKRDTEESLSLLEGVRAVREAAGKILSRRQSRRSAPRVTVAGNSANRLRQQSQSH